MEAEYRKRIQETYDQIQSALGDVDPDLAECEQSMGSMTITFGNRTKCILSAQPSVKQLWVALAARGTAYHFNYHNESGKWIDDKGRGLDLMGIIKQHIKEVTGLEIEL